LQGTGVFGSLGIVSPSPKSRRTGPPHNPEVRELVQAKRRSCSEFKRDERFQRFRGWHERGYLAHRDEPGLTQFVTFRLADTFPESLRSEWEHLWKIEDDKKRRTELEAYLDRGHGECHLRRPQISALMEGALRHFNNVRYELHAWCIMPNHVHVLFKVTNTSMSSIVESWKKYTSLKANSLLGRSGRFWEADYWDTFMRDSAHETKTVRYIENNPTKAHLVLDPKEWPWSSARFRDCYEVLRL
jgi:putative transposase